MAITFVGNNWAGKAGATSGTSTIALNSGLTGGSRSSVQAGDLVIAAYATGSTADRTLTITDGTSDYTLINTELYANGTGFDVNMRVAYKIMGSTPDASVVFGATGSSLDAGVMQIFVFSGVAPDTPLDVAAVPATGTGTGQPNPGPITPTSAGSKIMVFAAGSASGAAEVLAASTSLNGFISNKASDTNAIVISGGYKDWTSGAFDPGVYTGNLTASNLAWAAMSIALRPFTEKVYKGNRVWSAAYKGTRADAALYKGIRALHP